MKRKVAFALLFGALALMLAAVPALANKGGFTQGILVDVEGDGYYLAGVPVGNGATDVPGHYWVQAGPYQLVGKHYNSGPLPKFWSSDAPEGGLLYVVHGVIDEWTAEKAEMYAAGGYTHYHELISADSGEEHPTLVVWLKHIARTSFNLDGGPAPQFSHMVTPGVDYEFIPNYAVPYMP